MFENPMDVLKESPVRKSRKQKQAFRESVQSYAESLGYPVSVEKGSFGARNVVIGNPATAKFLVTAHYDTPAAMFFPNLITPCNFFTYIAYMLVVTAAMMLLAAVPVPILKLSGMAMESMLLVWLIVFYGLLILMMFGPANKNNANDNTSGVVTVLETAKGLPEQLRDQVCFVLFDLEEAGLFGSSSYAKKHDKEVKTQLVLNLDCCGDGDHIIMFPTSKLKKDHGKMDALQAICIETEGKSLEIRRRGYSYYPSDQRSFPRAVGIGAFRKNRFGTLYCDKIHTHKDTILDVKNVSFLRDRMIELFRNAV